MEKGLLSNFRAVNPPIDNGALDKSAVCPVLSFSPSIHTVPLSEPRIPTSGPNRSQSRFESVDGGFSLIFRRKYERLDWSKIAALDLETIYRNHDTKILQQNLTQLAFFDLEQELKCHELDPQFVKLFQIMQLSLEYLLYVQDWLQRLLEAQKSELSGKIKQRDEEYRILCTKVDNLDGILTSSKEELKKRKRLILTQQELINSFAKGRCHRCPICDKIFVERGFLEEHFRRKHPGCDSALLGQSPGKHNELAVYRAELAKRDEEQAKICHELNSARLRIQDLERSLREAQENANQKQVQGVVDKLQDTLRDLQSKYDSLQLECRTLEGRVTEKQSGAEIKEKIDKKVGALQESFESKLRNSEDVWKDKFMALTEEYKSDIQKMERELKAKADEQIRVYETENVRLAAQNDEKERRIQQLLTQFQQTVPPPQVAAPQQAAPKDDSRPRSPAFKIQQIKIQTTPTPCPPARRRSLFRREGLPPQAVKLREDLVAALDRQLEEYGIPPGASTLSDKEREEVIAQMKDERTRKQGTLPKLAITRSYIEKQLGDKEPAEYSPVASTQPSERQRTKPTPPPVAQPATIPAVTSASYKSTDKVEPSNSPDAGSSQASDGVGIIPQNIVKDRKVTFTATTPLPSPPSPRPPKVERYPDPENIPTQKMNATAKKPDSDSKWFSDSESN